MSKTDYNEFFTEYVQISVHVIRNKKIALNPNFGSRVKKRISLETFQTCETPKSEKALNPNFERTALEKLQKFETGFAFRKVGFGLRELAIVLGTNVNYASILVKRHRSKGFIAYIRDLRLDYITQKMMDESKFRQYSNRALASECGFGCTKSFVHAFKLKFKISPGLFVEQFNDNGRSQKASDAECD
ncbi:AraC family transcriptional regulator [Flavobacterium sp.]|uniref:helix-turn-helix domain-containing protein n=1 Tax=Flavobacterium sp. TaxID=239 RepID=UPI001206E7D4|nr:helix-turn-helix domain-containing protein [Flavobacterium sp.]RZJ73860.1 MAG: AraC family transcriptional regulator [Flavobacterium sp.]